MSNWTVAGEREATAESTGVGTGAGVGGTGSSGPGPLWSGGSGGSALAPELLRAPWLRSWDLSLGRSGYRLRVLDQPGRWMSSGELARLAETLAEVGLAAMDELPTYGVFSGERSAFANRVIGVVSLARTGAPVAFAAMVYLPVELGGEDTLVLHLGLAMISREHRGMRLQGALYERMFFLPSLNQGRVRWIVSSLGASPAGIGAVSDRFDDPFPSYRGGRPCRPYHLEVARQLLARHRVEFGCAAAARLDPRTFVVVGANDPATGGAHQFIAHDPVSRYRREECNRFCSALLRYERGDELLQVARLNLIRGLVKILGGRCGGGNALTFVQAAGHTAYLRTLLGRDNKWTP